MGCANVLALGSVGRGSRAGEPSENGTGLHQSVCEGSSPFEVGLRKEDAAIAALGP